MFNFKHSVVFSALALSLTACGGSDDNETNTAPYSITLSSNTVAENQAGATIGTLSATDDQGDSVTFALASGADARFEIDGVTLKLAADQSLDFEPKGVATPEITLPVIVSDGESEKEETLVIKVTDELDYYGFYDGNGQSTVSYSGQVARHAIIAELNNYISSTLATEINNGDIATKAEILAKLHAYFYDPAKAPAGVDVAAILAKDITLVDNSEQANINAISTGKNLQAKIAGNDSVTDHKDWKAGDKFEGFSAAFMGGSFENTPEGLLLRLLDKLAENAEAFAAGTVSSVYVTADGQDLKQLIQKFLLGAVAFQQGADDYLGDDVDGKGLKADNTAIVENKTYTNLEHQWDEGFGYFGAARDYLAYTDEEIAAKGGRDGWSSGYYDTNGDGKIDLNSEFNFGNSTNAAKRDLGSLATTDLTKDAMEGFLKGRALINANAGSALTEAQMDELKDHRDQAVLAWEKSIAATVIHYINDTVTDLNGISDETPTADLAKHWSELKGFLLGLQFNPASPLSDADFTIVNDLVGDKPDVSLAGKANYITGLETARTKLQTAYAFDATVAAQW
ncbi:cadherin [Catenovulum agarivorans DS-2]|uniref:Cadherin n=1 Tax=Catenovulum agarivorans DS-2 TaxID=1328313 RepID=W7QGQ6_9ALTE|nr:DUF4856 domain-containing protein [Catenovulum agarivorans]EWH12124.1 cadherin [Catenovulum agarivorans DS-2]